MLKNITPNRSGGWPRAVDCHFLATVIPPAILLGLALLATPAKACDCCFFGKKYVLVEAPATRRVVSVVEEEPVERVVMVRRVRQAAPVEEEFETREVTPTPQTRAAQPTKQLPRPAMPAKEQPKAIAPAKTQPRAALPTKQTPRAVKPSAQESTARNARAAEAEDEYYEEEVPVREVRYVRTRVVETRAVRTVRAVPVERVYVVRGRAAGCFTQWP